MENNKVLDILIIGGGPSGLTAAIFAHNKNFKTIVIDGGSAGGQLKNLYPYKPVYNYPGYSQISGGDLSDIMLNQVKDKGILIRENDPVHKIDRESDEIITIKTKNETIQSKSVILACGLGLFQPNQLNVPGESELKNSGIYYTIKNLDQWEGKEVAVFGGGNSAVDNAILLNKKGTKVTLVHKLNKFQAESTSVDNLQKQNTDILLGWKTEAFEKTNKGTIKVRIKHTKEGTEQTLEKDRCLINIGLKPNIEFLNQLDVDKKGKKILVDPEMRTSIQGIFGCGDVVDYPGKVRLIVTAIGEAATAVNSAERYMKSKAVKNKRVHHEQQ